MKKIKRFGVFALAALMAVGTCACVGKNNVKDGRYTIGICQIVEHEALEEANKGFKDALTEKLGDKVRFDVKNAQNDIDTCATIINGFVSSIVVIFLACNIYISSSTIPNSISKFSPSMHFTF